MRTALRRTFVILAIALMLVVPACGKKKGTGGTTLSTTTARIHILAPQPGDVTGPTVHVKAELIGGTLVPLTDSRLQPNGGHIHLVVDGQIQTMGAQTEQDITGLKPGPHILQMEFVDAQHKPFSPRVIAAVTITTQAS